MSALTPEDIANVCKLLERLRTGELNLIPSVATAYPRTPNGKSEAMLQRVEELLAAHLRRMQEPLGDGGPAFPVMPPAAENGASAAGYPYPDSGMTLRDYIAAKAMQTLVGGAAAQNICDRDPRYDGTNFGSVVALNAYEFADAMLRARSGS